MARQSERAQHGQAVSAERTVSLGGLDSTAARRIPALGEARLLRAHEELASQLRDVSDVDKAARIALRFSAALFAADHRCLAMLTPGSSDAAIVEISPRQPADPAWPARALADFAHGRKPELPSSVAVARLRRRRRPWGTLALRWNADQPDWNTRNALTRLAAVTNEAIERIETRRLAEVRARIDRKILEQLRPKDLLYQILDGLRSLTGYDHSGTILLRADNTAAFELVAEQLAFRKGKSPRIGVSVPCPPSSSRPSRATRPGDTPRAAPDGSPGRAMPPPASPTGSPRASPRARSMPRPRQR